MIIRLIVAILLSCFYIAAKLHFKQVGIYRNFTPKRFKKKIHYVKVVKKSIKLPHKRKNFL
jgi:hypothetical protein